MESCDRVLFWPNFLNRALAKYHWIPDCHDIAHICMGWIGWSMLKPGPMLVTLSPRQLAARMTGSQAVPVDELCIFCPYFLGLFNHWLYLWYLSVLFIWLSIHFHASTSRRMKLSAQGSAKLLRIPSPPLDPDTPWRACQSETNRSEQSQLQEVRGCRCGKMLRYARANTFPRNKRRNFTQKTSPGLLGLPGWRKHSRKWKPFGFLDGWKGSFKSP